MIFMLDNFDSFTYNLYQYFGELGEEVVVSRPGEASISDISALNPELIVISPGPCSPNEAVFALEVIEYFKDSIPILGICLGHQAIGQVFGAKVVRAKTPVHGKVSTISHDGQGVYLDLPEELKVTRYHSLALEKDSLPEDIIVTAWAADGEIMGIRHTRLPIEGVQFHPEAILTDKGLQLLENAVKTARRWKVQQKKATVWQIRELAVSLPPQQLVYAFKTEQNPFFLDSGNEYGEFGEYSYLGAFPFLKVSVFNEYMNIQKDGELEIKVDFLPHQNALSVLDHFLSRYRTPLSSPFPFAGGAVGFFSYDLKDEIEYLSQKPKEETGFPLWTLAWYDGIIVYEHETKRYRLTACGMKEDGECDPRLAQVRLDRLEEIAGNFLKVCWTQGNPIFSEHHLSTVPFEEIGKSVPKAQYMKDLKKIIDYIYAGDIYQANLTQRFSLHYHGDPWDLYYRLRQRNSAPFSAFLPYHDFQILCTSPERFIRITPEGRIQTRPIKGTRPRGKTLKEDEKMAQELLNSEKDRAELTIIVDLERNDLGRICSYGTVKTKELIALEKFPAVWHLVATIEGKLKAELQPSELLKAIFPGGSITGAPKIRAMEIIDELEPYKRELYTGSIGYIGFDGAWDLNIVIRTILLKEGVAHVHAGGGIVVDSEPENEYIETIHKAGKLLEVLGVELNVDYKEEMVV